MKNKESVLKRLFAYGGKYKYLTIIGMILSGLSAIIALAPILFIWRGVGDIFNNYGNLLSDQEVRQGIINNAWWAVMASLIAIGIYFAALMFTHIAAFRIARNMRMTSLKHILSLPLGYFDETGSGKIRRVIDESAASTETYLAHQLPDLVGAFVTPLVILVLFFLVDWKLGIISILPIVLSFFSLFAMIGRGKERLEEYQTSLEDMNNEAIEYIRGIPVVKTFNQTIFSFEKFYKSIVDYKENVMAYTYQLRTPMTLFQGLLNSMPIFLVLGGIFLINGSMDKKEFLINFLFYLFITPICNTMMRKVMWTSQDSLIAEDALDRVDELLAEKALEFFENGQEINSYDIEIKEGRFKYPEAKKYAVDGINISIKENSTVALVGESGSGKSTIATLIARFWDLESGSVKIGGKDIKSLAESELMKNLSFVFQNTNLYKMSILDNVREGRPEASIDEVMEALEAAQCMEIIEKLPRGIDTVVGEDGVYLSGGESQRIALARGILKDAPIILLDEATAFTDPENEHKIQLAFERLTKNKTVLMIAHRLSTIQNADKIYLIEDGRVEEVGNHKTLLEKKGKYSSMWKEYQSAFVWKDSEVIRND